MRSEEQDLVGQKFKRARRKVGWVENCVATEELGELGNLKIKLIA